MEEQKNPISIGDKRRKRIFGVYSNNLNLLIKENILTNVRPKYKVTYICPICLSHFSEMDLDQSKSNPLTLEDVPPKSLGGKANVLTCKSCNNKCGADVDYHLSRQMTELDRREFRPGIEFDAHFEKDGRTIQGRVIVGIDGEIKVIHTEINNHPKKLEEHVTTTKGGDGVYIKYRKTNVNPRQIQLALLKTSYLLAFQKYGYSFILDPVYDQVREQLLNADKAIYPLDFWFNAPFPEQAIGVPFITEPGLESIMATFILKTDFSQRMFSGIIPLTTIPIEKITSELRRRFEVEKSFEVSMYSMSEIDCVNDFEAIKRMLDWIKAKK